MTSRTPTPPSSVPPSAPPSAPSPARRSGRAGGAPLPGRPGRVCPRLTVTALALTAVLAAVLATAGTAVSVTLEERRVAEANAGYTVVVADVHRRTAAVAVEVGAARSALHLARVAVQEGGAPDPDAVAALQAQADAAARAVARARALPTAATFADVRGADAATTRVTIADVALSAVEGQLGAPTARVGAAVQADGLARAVAALDAAAADADARATAAQETLDGAAALDPAVSASLRGDLDGLRADLGQAVDRSDRAAVVARADELARAAATLDEQTADVAAATTRWQEERAAAAAAAAARRPAATAGASRPSGAPAAEAAGGAAAPADAATRVAWTTFVGNTGGQAAVDACTGGLTRYEWDIAGKPYYPIHRGCGGAPILSLSVGDLVEVRGLGTFRVVDARDVARGAPRSTAAGVAGSILVQTCYVDDSRMRVMGLSPA